MKRSRKTTLNLSQLEGRIAPSLSSTLTWQGDTGSQWNGGTSTNTNWSSSPTPNKVPGDGAALIFPNAPAGNKTNNNDINGLDLKSLSFTGDGYLISGNAITLSGGITVNVTTSGGTNFQVPITLAADQTFAFSGVNGSQFAFGQIVLGGKTLTINNDNFAVQSASGVNTLTGAGALTKNGTGELKLLVANDFSGPVQVNAGVLNVGSAGALGATGSGNGTTIAGGATLFASAGSTLAEDLTLSGTGAAGQAGALVQTGSGAPVVFSLTGALRLGADANFASVSAFNDTITFAGRVGAADDALAVLTINCGAGDIFGFANTATFTTELAGTAPGAGGHDQLKVVGPVNLGGAALNVVPSFTPAVGAKFTVVDNDGSDAIVGTFAGLAEGASVTAGGVNFKISYKGLDGTTGNDAVLTVDSLVETPLPVTLSAHAKVATFTDRDGDLVTVKTNKGPFQQTDFRFIAAGMAGGGQLQLINFTTHPGDFTGANLTVTAKPGPLGGNGFVNVGFINATGIDLGTVKIGGDLGRINAGTVGGDAKVPGVKLLDVHSIGLLGTSTQASGGNLTSSLQGTLAKLAVKGDIRDVNFNFNGATDGKLGVATIGGSVVATASGQVSITAETGIGTVKIHGDVHADSNIAIRSHAALGAVSIGGSISGSGGVALAAFGQLPAPAGGPDLAIKSLTVAGSVENFVLTAGLNPNGTSGNADASIGSITVGGDWIASVVLAGGFPGTDFRIGTADDSKPLGIDRDQPAIFSSIGSFTVKGQALGTAAAGDMFGIVAERIGKARVGGRSFAFTNSATPEAFFAAPTRPGVGAESPVFDFTIRELGSTTPAGTVTGGVNLLVSPDGKTATFNDVDGDLVTVQRSVGTFVAGNLTIVADPGSGGGQLTKLTVTAAPNGIATNLTITARPGSDGGNGFVNLGELSASVVPLGTVSVAGDVEKFDGGSSITAKPGTAVFSAHSLGVVTPGATQFAFRDGLGKLIVGRDVAETTVLMVGVGHKTLGAVTIGGNLKSQSVLSADDGIGSVKIAGSVLDGRVLSLNASIGAITIGGDLVGNGVNRTLGANGQLVAPARGLDLAIKSLTVKGNVENALLAVGLINADAAIGAITVGRAWIASIVAAGVTAGNDGFIGTADDEKVSDVNVRDNATRFSTIASITIKGQALGSTTANDSFGIVAEQILKAKIGARTFKFDKGERSLTDAFAIGVTGPGPAPDNALSDFFIREIIA